MKKNEFIDAIATESKLSKADSRKALDAFLKATVGALKKGDKVALIGFGSFYVVKRSARIGHNPQTKKPMNIAARNVCRFKAGSSLNDVVK